MVEILGILLAFALAGAAWLLWRGVVALRRRLAFWWLQRRLLRRQPRQRAEPPKPAARKARRLSLPRLRGVRLRLARVRLRAAEDRSGAMAAEIERLRVALRMAERQRDAARAQLVLLGSGAAAGNSSSSKGGARDRFQDAKRAFALRFHPDRVSAAPYERAIRAAMFKEFWAELRRIERG